MIEQIEISGVNLELSDDIKKYIRKKVGQLDKFVPRHARKSIHAEVKMRQTNNRLGNKYECEVILHVPNRQITAKESTLNMFAAVDIVEEKLKNQSRKYKLAHIAHLRERHSGVVGWLKVRFTR